MNCIENQVVELNKFSIFPPEIIQLILLEISQLRDLIYFSLTNSSIREYCEDDGFWHSKYLLEYGSIPNLPDVTWKERFKFNYLARKTSLISSTRERYYRINEFGNLSIMGFCDIFLPNGKMVRSQIESPAIISLDSKILSASARGFILTEKKLYSVLHTQGVPPTLSISEISMPKKTYRVLNSYPGVMTRDNWIYLWKKRGLVKLPIPGVDFSYNNHRYALVSTEGKLYIRGKMDWSIYPTEKVYDLTHIPLPEPIKRVSLGLNHIAVISITGTVYIWGQNSMGALGLGKEAISDILKPYTSPQKLALPYLVSQIACGDDFTAVICDNKKIYIWGYDRHCLTDNDNDLFKIKTPLEIDLGSSVLYVEVLYKTSLVAVTERGLVHYHRKY